MAWPTRETRAQSSHFGKIHQSGWLSPSGRSALETVEGGPRFLGGLDLVLVGLTSEGIPIVRTRQRHFHHAPGMVQVARLSPSWRPKILMGRFFSGPSHVLVQGPPRRSIRYFFSSGEFIHLV